MSDLREQLRPVFDRAVAELEREIGKIQEMGFNKEDATKIFNVFRKEKILR